ncbi:MAG: hypothetical protein HQK76_15275 [Desulfobacterales bacterium]|nr:hypothetical protein [Desulfobacterales bacterium]
MRLTDEKNPYSNNNPFSMLGVDTDISSEELVKIRDSKIEEINFDTTIDPTTKIECQNRIKTAYKSIQKPIDRAIMGLFKFDTKFGEEECLKKAEDYLVIKYDFNKILDKADEIIPRTIDIKDPSLEFQNIHFSCSKKLKKYDDTAQKSLAKGDLKFIKFEC